MSGIEHRGFYKSQRMPHFDAARMLQFITIVLADAAPKTQKPVVEKTSSNGDLEFLKLDSVLDQSAGACLLRNQEFGRIVAELISDGEYLGCCPLAWVVMPNHVHLLCGQGEGNRLSETVRKLKGRSAYLYIRLSNNQGMKVWQKGYFDRAVRDMKHLEATIDYIHENPVKAGLCDSNVNWDLSSIHSYSHTECIRLLEMKNLLSLS